MLQIMKERCGQCLFSKDAVVDNERRAELLRECERRDSHFVCHKSQLAKVGEIVCRGFYDTSSTNLIRIAGRLGAIEFVGDPTKVAAE